MHPLHPLSSLISLLRISADAGDIEDHGHESARIGILSYRNLEAGRMVNSLQGVLA